MLVLPLERCPGRRRLASSHPMHPIIAIAMTGIFIWWDNNNRLCGNALPFSCSQGHSAAWAACCSPCYRARGPPPRLRTGFGGHSGANMLRSEVGVPNCTLRVNFLVSLNSIWQLNNIMCTTHVIADLKKMVDSYLFWRANATNQLPVTL